MAIYELDGERPDLPERHWIADNASVIGRVRLMTDASIWFGAVLRGDNEWIEIGERSQIQDNATLHTDPGFPITIGIDCVIGHNVILHGAKVGDNSLIGMERRVVLDLRALAELDPFIVAAQHRAEPDAGVSS